MRLRSLPVAALAVAVISSCTPLEGIDGSGAGSAAGGGSGSTGGGSSGTGGGGGSSSTGGGGGTASGGGSGGACLAGDFLQSLGRQKLLVGASMTNAIADRAPFSLRYQYLSAGLPPGAGPCSACDAACGQDWWGCWQDTSLPPGAFVRTFVAGAKARNMVPMLTYYLVLVAADWSEGEDELHAMNDAARAARIFNDFRFMLQQVGQEVALIHVEPDFWGYAQQFNADPTALPAKVKAGNPTDCADEPDTFVGLGRCFTKMTRKYAPNAKVGLHASSWATNQDVFHTSDASVDPVAEGGKVGRYLAAVAPDADFIAVDASDRDAGWYQLRGRNTWWDETNTTLPHFRQAFAFTRAVAEAAQKPIIWWQLPVGHAQLDDTFQRYRDNRVNYFFAHPAEVAATHAAGFAFGSGQTEQTNPATDGDHLVGRVQAHVNAGGQAPCP